ncbi:prepilin-type N-terminal cleavage/methylation domain-containing protein [Acinetobacter sp. SwsAc6]|jgi:type IV fimbrial biogenesis protein FimT|uniref:pilus assembly FimT family protein n=1 Tax=Acinetobacter TaxID=469 RepID=UPI000EA2FDC1|nr:MULTISPECIES: prepilin-type N-terminal cleavage/methylation domain-containing protein [Acinetobacter]NWK72834.1 prepilin-type N-terminal cleavage/methylation domain-containing protein [Acinetobacter sp. SwsAc6]RKG46114.1 type II secretion system protein GspH [Acinetobacter cumulans]RZG61245.1 type II secretion system protein GspH [Acinetobacter sp. WCHAc060006]
MYKSKGFTLIELMVTIAILAIIATMAVPSFNSISLNQNLKKSTNTLTQEIKAARTKAILEKRQITLKLASSANNAPTTLNWMQEGKVALKTPANDELKFDGNGVLVSTFSVVELCKTSGASTTNPTSSKKITLTKFGQIEKIEDGSCP